MTIDINDKSIFKAEIPYDNRIYTHGKYHSDKRGIMEYPTYIKLTTSLCAEVFNNTQRE